MLRNLFKIALRNIRKHAGYSLIIVLGLVLGITSSLFLLLFVFDDLSYDQYHENKDRIYRVVTNIKETDDAFTWAIAQVPFAHAAKEEYPEVENTVRLFNAGRLLLKYRDQSLYEEDLYYADSTVFDVFTYDLLEGDPERSEEHTSELQSQQ